jgi:hypothetical protein
LSTVGRDSSFTMTFMRANEHSSSIKQYAKSGGGGEGRGERIRGYARGERVGTYYYISSILVGGVGSGYALDVSATKLFFTP